MAKTGQKTLLELKDIHKTYGAVKVLNGVNLTLNAGQTTAIIGPSGAGKSTLLHIAGLLDTADAGKIMLQGSVVSNESDRIRACVRNHHFGFVYQHHHLLREFTAFENVLLPATIRQTPTPAHRKRAGELLERLGLSARMTHYPHQLSGGEKQRVAIARALMNKPNLLLADEPTGNLDTATAAEVSKLFTQAVEEENMALLLVTHNTVLAAECDAVYEMKDKNCLAVET